MGSRLLMDESPLTLQPSLAVVLGLNEAIFLQQVHYWLNPKFNKNYSDGRFWVHNTVEQWKAQFPFWGEKTIRRTISTLESLGVLVSYVATIRMKKTKFYAIDYARLEVLQIEKEGQDGGSDPSGQNDRTDPPKRANACGQSDQMHLVNMTRTYIDTETTEQENTLLSQKHLPIWANGGEEEEDSSHQMIMIWNDLVQPCLGGQSISLTPNRAQEIQRILRLHFDENLEQWENYCLKIQQSKFLMGQNDSGFRVYFDWAIKPENILKIQEGAIYDKAEAPKTSDELPWDTFVKVLKAEHRARGYGEVWTKAVLALVQRLGQATYKSWFSKLVPLDLEREQVHIQAPSRFVVSTLQTRYGQDILESLRGVSPHIRSVSYSIGEPA